ncbi:MAG: sugar transferase [Kiritimatiellae bacterium]|nr:sugar transferase [Kiritimatiellia bacterium]
MAKSVNDTINSIVAVIADAVAVVIAIYASVWVRFDSGWFQVLFGRPDNVYQAHSGICLLAIAAMYISGRHLKLYSRPQRGTFVSKIPRYIRYSLSISIVILLIQSIFRNFFSNQISSAVILIFACVFFFVLLIERGILFSLELHIARKTTAENSILIIGANSTAVHLIKCFSADPRLSVKVCGVVSLPGDYNISEEISSEQLLGTTDDFFSLLDKLPNVSQVIVADPSVEKKFLRSVIFECEKRFIRFNIVPDVFFMLTSSIEIETIDDIPLMGLKHSPLDKVSNRIIKRIEDIVCALIGLIVASPIILVFAILVKRSSPGPIFFRQIRCGYAGKEFTIYKLRTMKQDAEAATGPVFAQEDDPRRTKLGAWMRSHNVDELPQLWNVLIGNMSMVGPRPERPVFVEQFTTEISHYMRRHDCKPGITGWAQVHGLRGNTSIEARLNHDLWYQENWSLALDLKIMLRTVFAVRNAY